MKFHIMYQKRYFFDIYYKLHVPLTCCDLPEKVLQKLAKRHKVTTIEELVVMRKEKLENWQNRKHVKAVLKLINKIKKLLRVSLPSKEQYHRIRRSDNHLIFFIKLLQDLLTAPFYTVYHFLEKHKPLPSGFVFLICHSFPHMVLLHSLYEVACR